MKKLWDFLQGKKSYIVAGVTFLMGGLMAVGVEIPEYVWVLLSAAGLGAVRNSIK